MKPGVIILLALWCIGSFSAGAQEKWQWGATMGSSYNAGLPDNMTGFIQDRDGNYYVLHESGNVDRIGTGAYTGQTTNSNLMAVSLIKFDCDGVLQWVKMISSNSLQTSTLSYNLVYDEKHDGVYAYVRLAQNSTVYVGNGRGVNDTSFITPFSQSPLMHWISFAPNGKIRWIRPTFPAPDYYSPFFTKLIPVAGDGIYAYVVSGNNTSTGPFSLFGTDTLVYRTHYWAKYDEDLNPLWCKKFSSPGSIDPNNGAPFSPFDIQMAPDGNVYMSGRISKNNNQDSILINNKAYSASPPGTYGNGILLKMDKLGNVKWVKKSNNSDYDLLRKIVITKHNRIYVSGGALKSNDSIFGGYHIVDYGGTILSVEYILEVDTNGNLLRGINADYKYNEGGSADLADHTGNIYFSGLFVNDSTNFGGNWFYRKGDSYGLKIFKLDEDLNILEAYELENDDNNSPATYRVSAPFALIDEKGSRAYGGTVGFGLHLTDSSYYSHGGSYDNFIAIYGGECNGGEAIIAPVDPSALIATGISKSAIDVVWHDNANYEQGFYIYRSATKNGTYQLIDSVAANTTSFQNTTLTKATTYWYKVFAYNAAGISDATSIDSATTWDSLAVSVADFSLNKAVIIAPNPFAEQTTITCEPEIVGSDMIIYDLSGRRVKSLKLSATNVILDNSGMSAGSYFYEIISLNGERINRGYMITK